MTILTPAPEPDDDITPAYLFLLLDRFIRDPPRSLNEENRTNLKFAVRSRFEKLGLDVPEDISNLLQMADLLLSTHQLVKLVHKTGPRGTASIDECKEMLSQIEPRDCSFTQVANALLYMVLGRRDLGHTFDAAVFVATLKDHRSGKRLDWQDVVGAFDRDQLTINKQQFLALYNALLPLAQEYENFDIQRLWGGTWNHPDTQLSFIVSFLSCTPDELDASTIPRLRKAFTLDMYNDAPEDVKTYAAGAVRHPLVSLDAVTALFGMIFQSQEAYKVAKNMKIPETIINPHTDLFVVATAAVPGPWASLQSQAFTLLFTPFLRRRIMGDRFVFHGLWKRDASWLIHRLIGAYNANPIDLEYIYEHAIVHDWLPTLTGISTEFGVDLAALAHGRGQLNLDAWLTKCHEVYPNIFPGALARILEAKAKNEMSMQRDPAALQTVSLSLKTVYGFLNFLDHTPMSEESHAALLKLCINAYPRLINYGEGVDEVIEANGKNGHKLAAAADEDMHNNFKKLYNGETTVRDIIEDLQRSKLSEDPKKQELFACMINGLFEEYSCFAEYPIDALSTTAVLFGGIINFNLLSSFALQVALANVLEAIQSSRSREEKMYKFGLQALKQFHTRLPDWPSFCERLLRIDELQGTEIWEVAEKVLRSSQNSREAHTSPKLGMANGTAEDYGENAMPAFTCVYADPPLREGFYEAPPEDVQDKVLFLLNNVSPVNVEEKQADLKEALEEKHHQWFAEYLVDQRAKLQANFQGLYLTLLEQLGDETLWEEVLRETYVSIARLLNSEAALNSASEKAHLKSLGSWLGSITLARDYPIRLKNLSFRDLLLQAHATERLAVAIPFTSKVLTEAAKSELFRPPNPWTLDVLKLLIEIYYFTELRINLKFEIETLCTNLKVDIKTTEPSRVIRDSQVVIEEEYSTMDMPEHVEPFHDVAMLRNRAARGSFSPTSLAENIPDISGRLVYPPPPNNVMSMEQLRTIFAQAAHSAITEIIFPVVERSVTIAAIAASQLAIKDFATEPDEAKLRNAAHTMVKSLSGSLAMVTCREPLRLSITTNIKTLVRGNHEAIGEGTILMFVNDNLDTICRVVEEAAEKYSIAEIENQLQQAVNLRQIHNSTAGDEPFNYPPISKYAYVIPDPYRPLPGGLRPEQLAIYEDFGPAGNIINHLPNQMPAQDVLPDQFALADGGAGLRSAQHPQRLMGAQTSTLGAVGTSSIMGLGQTGINGYGAQGGLERAEALYQELLRALRESPEERISQLSKASPIREAYEQLIQVLDMAGANPMLRDELASHLSHRMTDTLLKESARKLEIEVLVQLLTQICNYSIIVASRVHLALVSLSDEELLNPPVTAHLISARLLDVRRVDSVLSKMLREKKTTESIACLSEVVDELLLSEHPLMVRGQIAGSFEALLSWVHDNPELEEGKAILNKLRVPDSNDMSGPNDRKQDDVEHIFEEWLHLHRPDASDKSVAAFMFQLNERGVFTSQEELAIFIRVCLDLTLVTFDQDETRFGLSAEQAYVNVDSLASLITALTLHQAAQTDGEVKPERVHFLESILSIVILYQCDHYKVRGDTANSKLFFRLYSSLLFDISHVTSPYIPQEDMYLVMARAFLAIQPNYLPGFVFSWLALISHRVFMPAMLRMASDQVTLQTQRPNSADYSGLRSLSRPSSGYVRDRGQTCRSERALWQQRPHRPSSAILSRRASHAGRPPARLPRLPCGEPHSHLQWNPGRLRAAQESGPQRHAVRQPRAPEPVQYQLQARAGRGRPRCSLDARRRDDCAWRRKDPNTRGRHFPTAVRGHIEAPRCGQHGRLSGKEPALGDAPRRHHQRARLLRRRPGDVRRGVGRQDGRLRGAAAPARARARGRGAPRPDQRADEPAALPEQAHVLRARSRHRHVRRATCRRGGRERVRDHHVRAHRAARGAAAAPVGGHGGAARDPQAA
jgi:CCR4-NOT transcription complex subunit 1